jgi:hypothetical protein
VRHSSIGMIKKNLTHKNKRGVSLLIATLIGFTAILIGFAVANLALKEVIFSGSVRDSEIAFYAANSGVECGLFADLRNLAFDPDGQSFGPLDCNSQTVSVISTDPPPEPDEDQFCIGDFTDNLGNLHTHQGCWELTTGDISLEEGDTNAPCFNLRVVKEKFLTVDELGGDFTYFATALESRGYNTCNTETTRRLERAIRALY